MTDGVHELSMLIGGADAILIVTGAGVSTETGIPDFRGPQGVWNTQRPVMYQDFLTSEADRVTYWNQKVLAAETIEVAKPGAVHKACVVLENAGKLEAIVTQNIDGLHTIAKSSEERVVEVHGTGREAVCLTCKGRSPIVPHLKAFTDTGVPPRCHCGGLLKPATISFGQQLDPKTMAQATQAAEACDLVIAMGTTLSVYPAAEIPLIAARRGVPYVIINQGDTEHDGMPYITLRIEAPVGPTFSQAVTQALT
ncbi:MAG: Sir2 family NAD-dependent protein deacetylase [Actinomycetia bacterium]|nr:Sir2 family NAD-dependent protein deacetylase [Actinomycetes bacterium]